MTNYFANGFTRAYLNFRKSSLISGYLFHMQKFVKGHLRFFFVGDESPEPIQSSKAQNQCQLLKGSPATFLTDMGEILSIFMFFWISSKNFDDKEVWSTFYEMKMPLMSLLSSP